MNSQSPSTAGSRTKSGFSLNTSEGSKSTGTGHARKSGYLNFGHSNSRDPRRNRMSTASMVTQSEVPVLTKIFVPKPGKSHALLLVDRMQHESEMTPLQRIMHRVLSHFIAEAFMASIIFFNLIVMIIETDYHALDDVVKGKYHWTTVCGWIVLGVFVVEITARWHTYREEFWQDRWNIFDFLIVFTDGVFSVIAFLAHDIFPVSMLRLFRLAKLARVSKIFMVFPELRLLIAGLATSISAIFWGTVLLIFSLLMWSIAAVLFIHPLNKRIDHDISCERCPRAYSSVMQASLTFFQQIVTGDSWGQVSIPLIEAYPYTGIFFVAVFMTVGMAVLNLILGVVVSVAQQAKEIMEAEDHKEEIMFKAERHTHLLHLCLKMDKDRDGVISQAEMLAAYDEPGEFRDALVALEITKDDIDIVWKAMDTHGVGLVSYDDVVSALYSVKSSDTHFMLAYIKHYITVVKECMTQAIAEVRKEEAVMESGIDKATEEIRLTRESLQITASQNELPRMQRVCEDTTEFHPANVETRTERTSSTVRATAMNDEEGAWLTEVCNRIARTRVELGDILIDLEGKFEPFPSPMPASTPIVGATKANADPSPALNTRSYSLRTKRLQPEKLSDPHLLCHVSADGAKSVTHCDATAVWAHGQIMDVSEAHASPTRNSTITAC